MLVGGATLFLLPLGWLLRSLLGLDSAELAVGFLAFHAAFLINDPHFCVTYLLFYRDVRGRALGNTFRGWQQARYWVAGAVVPLVLATWNIVAFARDSRELLGLQIQLMFFLVGWHYVKQGFGTLMVLSARRGVSYSRFERWALLFHCFAGWAYAWASPAHPSREEMEKGVWYTALARPVAFETATFVVFLVSAVVLAVTLIAKWRREQRLPPSAGLVGLLTTIWLWTVYSSADPLLLYVIPALHSVQYLYFVWLLKRNEAREGEGPPDFKRPTGVRLLILAASAIALGWLLLRGAPGALDDIRALNVKASGAAPSELGSTPYFAAFFVFVNIHHYFMDTVLWRRDNPETRYLRA